MTEFKNLISMNEAAEYLGYSKSTLYKWCSSCKINYFKIGKFNRFSFEDLDDFLKRHNVAVKGKENESNFTLRVKV